MKNRRNMKQRRVERNGEIVRLGFYKLYNTNIHEIIEMKKHAYEKCEFFMKS